MEGELEDPRPFWPAAGPSLQRGAEVPSKHIGNFDYYIDWPILITEMKLCCQLPVVLGIFTT